MINYIRHDHEFYGVAKLSSGDEVMGVMIATKEEGQTLVFVQDPATPKEAPMKRGDEVGLAIGLVKWMMWSDEEFFILQEADIISIAPMSIGAENMYKLWKRKELGLDDDKHWEVDINKNMGLVGKVSEMRKKLEDLWKKEI
mgnify:FL=1|jgi:hypothetical protein|tara:strand:- start:4953 stop:5378 length:426 start_codon:yes stop_codon:yes gene_type:complete